MNTREILEQHLKRSGITMRKQISSGGFLSSPTYDSRTAHSIKRVEELTEKGFYISDDPGIFLWNAMKNYNPKGEQND